MRYREAGATIYIQEELSDARLRCEELKNYINKALKIIDSSSHKEHLYAVAGDLINGMPESLFKLEKSLMATAMAVNKIDYEEIKQNLRPEKIDELERVLEEVRINLPRRRGETDVSKPDSEDF